MRDIVLFLAGGAGFWTAWLLLVAAVVAAEVWRSGWATFWRYASAVLAGVLLFLSSTPFDRTLYVLSVLLVAAWLVLEHTADDLPRMARGSRVAVGLMLLISATSQVVASRTPTLQGATHARMYVIGDSISAGIGTPGVTPWPELVRQRHGVEVVDLAVAGATLESALRVVQRVQLADGLVLLEIGGNDILRYRSPQSYEEHLRALLEHVKHPTRQIVMFEIPVIPSQAEIARIQRRLARAHGVTLIPKSHFAGVLRVKDGSLDGLHLSAVGQQYMADLVWKIVGPALKPSSVASRESALPLAENPVLN